ncbi:P-loop containing nucleoside triphosphate hydrolase protein [Pholiota molesta]|nr:P-loop containing nucleoside triphosphate hydrolase protein [Pholiota molesta]
MFAIASDDVEQVRQVLASGDAGPNESVGPQSALEFTLTNDKLTNKLEIVKALLAYGADPAVAKNLEIPSSKVSASGQEDEDTQDQPRPLMEEMDAATRYYLDRADSIHTRRMSVLIHRSFFRPLTRVRYDLIGQDRALEQLFRVLSMHSRELAVSPMVVMLCGPSGHGKSLLARKFGSLLEVPTHTVNMTTLRSTHDLWESHSMSPYETPTTCTLAEFLMNNEGKRCVVVLDEIEKVEDPKTLYSLLMPWELGRCAFEANVIWLGTSNIGHELVFQHRDTRKNAEELMSREEYVELMALLRPKVSERLGTSILSRITTVLPFLVRSLPHEEVQKVIDTALGHYCPDEGARSLHRAVSNQLVDII